MPNPYTLGEKCKLYYSATPVTSTTYTVPATVLDNIRNVKINMKTDTPEYTTRANGGYKQYAPSLKDATITFEIKNPGIGTTDAGYTAVRTAYLAGSEMAFYALDGLSSESGAEGPAGNFIISDMSRSEGNGEVVFYTVELKPSSFNGWHIAT